jgi:hypothetical protein
MGRVVEDCIAIILYIKKAVKLSFMKFHRNAGAMVPVTAVPLYAPPTKKSVFDVPGRNEAVLHDITWSLEIETHIFITLNLQYKIIDFIIAKKTKKMFYIYFVQCTI